MSSQSFKNVSFCSINIAQHSLYIRSVLYQIPQFRQSYNFTFVLSFPSLKAVKTLFHSQPQPWLLSTFFLLFFSPQASLQVPSSLPSPTSRLSLHVQQAQQPVPAHHVTLVRVEDCLQSVLQILVLLIQLVLNIPPPFQQQKTRQATQKRRRKPHQIL